MLSDTNVIAINSTRQLEELFGGGSNSLSPCAAMLVYIRQADVPELFSDDQRNPEEEKLCKEEEAQPCDGAVDLEAQLAPIPEELTYDQHEKIILGIFLILKNLFVCKDSYVHIYNLSSTHAICLYFFFLLW
jgi:hypothetical protein